MRLFSVLFIVHSLCLTINVAQGVSLSKPGCPEKCGNVTIPYPFGIGSRCSYNASFSVTCRHDTNPPKPFLSSVNLEALAFSLDDRIVRVMQVVSHLNCTSIQREMLLGISLLGNPYAFSSIHNRLAVVGCKNMVWLTDSRTVPSFLGCTPICGYNTSGCNGMNCCQREIPPRLQEPKIFYKSSDDNTSTNCGYVFLADRRWLKIDYKNYTSLQNHSYPHDMSLEYVPVVLDWEFDSSEVSNFEGVICVNQSMHDSCSLDGNVNISINTARCYCKTGFEGNPYLPIEGCQDIDECSDKTLDHCPNKTCINKSCLNWTCINNIGSFTCEDPGRYSEKSMSIIGFIYLFVLIFFCVAWTCLQVMRAKMHVAHKRKFYKRNGGLLLEQQLSSHDGGVDRAKLFNSEELAEATDNYNENRILGRGGQGTVYKGMLTDGTVVAVKRSKKVDQADLEVFINEVVILSQINHRNIVKLLGCCLETEVPLLVYEFVPNGTLFQHIHEQDDEIQLSWKMRVRIAAEAAGALSYLHSAASAPIYHRDIKSTNILLDDKYRAKVSDFGISRSLAIDQTHLTTRVLGTFGYLDPEYFRSSQFTEKSDVYSFGVVMVELLTGEKAVPTDRAEEGMNLAIYFLHSIEENHLFDILDPEVLKEGRTEEIMAIAELAKRCLNSNGKRRPTMKEVAVELEGFHMLEKGTVFGISNEDTEFQSAEPSEDKDISSISDSTNLDIIIAESFESPLQSTNP